MTRYMLDTNMLSDLIKDPGGRVARRIAEVGEDRVCTTIIVAAELRYGSSKRGSKRLVDKVEKLLSEISVLPFEAPADIVYGQLRADLEAAGRPIGSNDMLIAAHARAADATMVTANTGEFERVAGLRVENWLI